MELLRWKIKYLTVLRLAIYLLQTTGIIVAYTRAVVSGAEPYHTVEHIRTFFSVGEQFGKITSQDDVYGVLENVMKRRTTPKYRADRAKDAQWQGEQPCYCPCAYVKTV